MVATADTAAPVPIAQPKVAACPKCNVILVPVQVKRSSGGGFIGGLLIFFGILGTVSALFLGSAALVGGFVLIGLGVVVAAVSGREPGLMCPNCGVQGATLGELAWKVTPPPPGGTLRTVVGVVILIVGLGFLIYQYRTADNRKAEQSAGQSQLASQGSEAPQSQSAWTEYAVVVTRISRDRYRTANGSLIVTKACSEPAKQVPATLKYNPRATGTDASDNV